MITGALLLREELIRVSYQQERVMEAMEKSLVVDNSK